MDQLPLNYDYISVSVSNNKYKSFRIKEVTDKESVEAWVHKYSEETKTTWRKRKTFPNCGKLNVYKIVYRCCHNTDRRVKGTGPSKHTGCDAKLVITINRFIENSKSNASNMQLVKSHPCLVMLNDKHNHDLNTAESLKYRDLLPEVKEQLIRLFYEGHHPASALKTYKNGLMLDLGDRYYAAAVDGRTMPSYSVVHKLFEKVFSKTYGDISGGEMEGSLKSLNNNHDRTVDEILPFSSDAEVEEVCKRLTDFCNKIKEKVRGNREVFLPAVKKMLAASEKLTDTDLLAEMHTFGTYSGIKQNARKKVLRRYHKTAIGVQPTAIARRKSCLPGKKKISAGKLRGQTTNTNAPLAWLVTITSHDGESTT